MTQVPPGLTEYVTSVVVYDVDLGGPGVHRGLPSTELTLVLPLDEPLTVSWAGDPVSRTTGWSSVSGLHRTPAEVHHQGHQRGVQLGLTVAGARALLGVRAAELSGELLSLDDLEAPGSLRRLPERLEEASPADLLHVVSTALVETLAEGGRTEPRAEIGRALARLTRGARVSDVADEVGYTRRHLATLVRRECGLTPKQVQRIARFQRSRRLLGRQPMVEVAARCGYADQAHLSREWRDLAGCTPSEWLREEFPFVQDLADDAAAG